MSVVSWEKVLEVTPKNLIKSMQIHKTAFAASLIAAVLVFTGCSTHAGPAKTTLDPMKNVGPLTQKKRHYEKVEPQVEIIPGRVEITPARMVVTPPQTVVIPAELEITLAQTNVVGGITNVIPATTNILAAAITNVIPAITNCIPAITNCIPATTRIISPGWEKEIVDETSESPESAQARLRTTELQTRGGSYSVGGGGCHHDFWWQAQQCGRCNPSFNRGGSGVNVTVDYNGGGTYQGYRPPCNTR